MIVQGELRCPKCQELSVIGAPIPSGIRLRCTESDCDWQIIGETIETVADEYMRQRGACMVRLAMI